MGIERKMNQKAGEMWPQISGPVICVDPIPWAVWLVTLVMLIAVIVLVRVVWSELKSREEIQKSEKNKRLLTFWATAVLLVGTVACLKNIAFEFLYISESNASEAKLAVFRTNIAESLYHYIFAIILSGVMFLVSLTMPWKKKTKEL